MPILHILPTVSESPFALMATDEAIFRAAIQTSNPDGILRFYHFQVPSVSIGFAQRDPTLLQSLDASNLPWVRRLTGGGTVFHGDDLVFCFTASIQSFPQLKHAKASYRALHACLKTALSTLNVKTDFFSDHQASNFDPREMRCFERAVADDLVIAGEKIAGGAERRFRGYVLHQGSIQFSRISLQYKDLEKSIAVSFCQYFGCGLRARDLSAQEKNQGELLRRTKYEHPEWNWNAKVPARCETVGVC